MLLQLLHAVRETIIMKNVDVKQYFANCPDLATLDDAAQTMLLQRGEEIKLNPRAILYSQGSTLDDTFCLLLSGELLVEISGKSVGKVPQNQLFGEMAYFITDKTRSATIRAGSLGALVLRIRLTQAELGTAPFAGLKSFLGAQAWDRFVSNSQQSV
jgi:hypothetical protein